MLTIENGNSQRSKTYSRYCRLILSYAFSYSNDKSRFLSPEEDWEDTFSMIIWVIIAFSAICLPGMKPNWFSLTNRLRDLHYSTIGESSKYIYISIYQED